jgi:hypothetical protein
MGKGLCLTPESKGTHVAFSAGTGILVFIDLIAKIALQELKIIPEQDWMHPDFRLVLYASFLNKDDAIGIHLIQKLQDLMKARKKNTFELHLKMMDKDRKRWDEVFIFDSLQ